MAAPVGNQFWKQRSKHGRDKLFTTPELLWEAASEYFEWCDNNPWIKVEQLSKPTTTTEEVVTGAGKTKNATKKQTLHYIAELPTARPYTLTGLCLYLDCGKNYFDQFKDSEGNEGFSGVITRIEDIIYTQKFEGAAVGAFNANIIARDLGLTDKKEHSGELAVKQITGMEIL
jgi:hypothetical protein